MPLHPDLSAAAIGARLDAFARLVPGDDVALGPMRALLAGSATPCARTHFAPGHFTASGCVLSPCGAQVLLVHHARLDRWLQPGGHVEADDAGLAAAARREVLEECGLAPDALADVGDVPVDLDVHAIPARRDEPGHLHFDVRFGFVADPAAPLQRSAESHAVRWFAVAAIDALGVDAGARRMIARCRQRLGGVTPAAPR